MSRYSGTGANKIPLGRLNPILLGQKRESDGQPSLLSHHLLRRKTTQPGSESPTGTPPPAGGNNDNQSYGGNQGFQEQRPRYPSPQQQQYNYPPPRPMAMGQQRSQSQPERPQQRPMAMGSYPPPRQQMQNPSVPQQRQNPPQRHPPPPPHNQRQHPPPQNLRQNQPPIPQRQNQPPQRQNQPPLPQRQNQPPLPQNQRQYQPPPPSAAPPPNRPPVPLSLPPQFVQQYGQPSFVPPSNQQNQTNLYPGPPGGREVNASKTNQSNLYQNSQSSIISMSGNDSKTMQKGPDSEEGSKLSQTQNNSNQSEESNREGSPARKKKKRSRWGDAEDKKTNVPGIPTKIPGNLNSKQQQQYLLHFKIEEISIKLRSGDLGIPDNPEDRSPSPEPIYNSEGKRLNTREFRVRKRLEEERHKLVQEALDMNPEYKPPSDYKAPSTKIQEKVMIPQDQNPSINFIGLLIGPRGNTLKKMEKETGCKIIIRGKGSVKEGKVGRPGMPLPGEDEPLHALVSGPTHEATKKAVEVISQIIKDGIECPEGANDLRRMQLRELAALNGTLIEEDMIRCRNCGATDHRHWECTEQKNVTNQIVCTKCGGYGHIAVDCTYDGVDTAAVGVPKSFVEKAKMDDEYMSLMAELGVEAPKKSSAPTIIPGPKLEEVKAEPMPAIQLPAPEPAAVSTSSKPNNVGPPPVVSAPWTPKPKPLMATEIPPPFVRGGFTRPPPPQGSSGPPPSGPPPFNSSQPRSTPPPWMSGPPQGGPPHRNPLPPGVGPPPGMQHGSRPPPRMPRMMSPQSQRVPQQGGPGGQLSGRPPPPHGGSAPRSMSTSSSSTPQKPLSSPGGPPRPGAPSRPGGPPPWQQNVPPPWQTQSSPRGPSPRGPSPRGPSPRGQSPRGPSPRGPPRGPTPPWQQSSNAPPGFMPPRGMSYPPPSRAPRLPGNSPLPPWATPPPPPPPPAK